MAGLKKTKSFKYIKGSSISLYLTRFYPHSSRVRTRKDKKESIKSEVDTSLDTKAQESIHQVRSRLRFGQESKKRHPSSPKWPQVRTGKQEKASIKSEVDSSSDRKARKSIPQVRSRLKFGQESKKRHPPSPKWPQVRTRKLKKASPKSEVDSSSDRKARISIPQVRSRLKFGQESKKRHPSSPKWPQVWTRKQEKASIKSEVDSGSDTKAQESIPQVRSRLKFINERYRNRSIKQSKMNTSSEALETSELVPPYFFVINYLQTVTKLLFSTL